MQTLPPPILPPDTRLQSKSKNKSKKDSSGVAVSKNAFNAIPQPPDAKAQANVARDAQFRENITLLLKLLARQAPSSESVCLDHTDVDR